MKKILFVFLLFLYSTSVFAGYGGYIGKYDNRRYGSLSEPEYNSVVKLTMDRGIRCTGGFISKDLILTNNHCMLSCQHGCTAEFWNGSKYEISNAKIISFDPKAHGFSGSDWGLLVSDKESNFYKPIAPISTPGQVFRGGYGVLRVINDDEIPFLKQIYSQTIEEFKEDCNKQKNVVYAECINKHVDEKLKQMNKKILFGDMGNFKVQTCRILGNYEQDKRLLKTDCDGAGGDSGAPLLRNDTIVGLNVGGLQMVFGTDEVNARALKTENFYPYTTYVIKKHEDIDSLENNFAVSRKSENNNKSSLGPLRPESGPENTDNAVSETIQQILQDFDCD